MAKKIINDSTLTAIADAIREKTGDSNTMTPLEMPTKIENIPTGGADEALLSLIAGTASGNITIRDVEHLGLTRFQFFSAMNSSIGSNQAVTSITFPDLIDCYFPSQLTDSNYGGFQGATNNQQSGQNSQLREIHLPEATQFRIYDSTGYTFMNLETIDAPKLTNACLQMYRTKLTTLSFPLLQTIKGNMNYNDHLTTINLPECTSAGQFQNNTALVNVSLPKLSGAPNAMFTGCTALEEITFPVARPSGGYMFNGCTSLKYAEFGSPINWPVGAQCFNNCSSLETVVIRATNSICSLGNVNAFTNTPIESGTGYVYVPQALLNNYKTASNWVTYANQIRAIEDYTVDGTIDGEFVPPTN